mgnify:CR=1 FL=1
MKCFNHTDVEQLQHAWIAERVLCKECASKYEPIIM